MAQPANNPFGAPPPTTSASPFGQPFGQQTSVFGAPSQAATGGGAPFGNNVPSVSNPFGAPSSQPSPFGSPSPFGTPSLSAQNSRASSPSQNPFGKLSVLSPSLAPPPAGPRLDGKPSTSVFGSQKQGPGIIKGTGGFGQLNAAAEMPQSKLPRTKKETPRAMTFGSQQASATPSSSPATALAAKLQRRKNQRPEKTPARENESKRAGPIREPTQRTKQLSEFAFNLANKMYAHLRKENIKPPPVPANIGNPQQRGVVDNLKEAYKKYRARVYDSLRKAEYIDDPEKRRKLEDALPFKGICENMCPEFEQIARIAEYDVKTEEKQQQPGGTELWPEPSRMVKKFGRSAAGQDAPLPMDVRSVDALRRTTDYLFNDLLQSESNLPSMHNYLWDRTRAVRKDFTFHSQKSPEEMKEMVFIFETITRFHATALHLLSRKGYALDDFDQRQEIEQLGRTILSLIEAYDMCRDKHVPCENEAEFRAYYLLLNAHDPSIAKRIPAWGKEFWFDSEEVQTALSLIQSMEDVQEPKGPIKPRRPTTLSDTAFTNYFDIVEEPRVSYTMACIAEVHFTTVRQCILKNLVKAYARHRDAPRTITASDLNKLLRFDTDEEAVEFVELHDFEFSTWVPEGKEPVSEPYLLLNDKKKYVPSPRVKQSYSGSIVERKRGNQSLPYVIYHTIFEDIEDEAQEAENSPDGLFVSQSEPPAQSPVSFFTTKPEKTPPTAASTVAPLGSRVGDAKLLNAMSTPKFSFPNLKAPAASQPTTPSTTSPFLAPSQQSGASQVPAFGRQTTTRAATQDWIKKPDSTAPQSSPSFSNLSQATPAPFSSVLSTTNPVSSSSPFASLTKPAGPAFSSSPQASLKPQSILSGFPAAASKDGDGASQSTPTIFPPPKDTPAPKDKPSGPSPKSSSTIFSAPSDSTPSLSSIFSNNNTQQTPVSTGSTSGQSLTSGVPQPPTTQPVFPSINKPVPKSDSQSQLLPSAPLPAFQMPGSTSASSGPLAPTAPPAGLGGRAMAPPEPRQPLQSSIPTQQPPPKQDLMGDFTNWFVNGDGGLMEQFTDVALHSLLLKVFTKWEKEEAERKRKEEDDLSWKEARAHQNYNLRVKFFYRWQKIAQKLHMKRVLREGKEKMRIYREQERALQKKKQEEAEKARRDAKRIAKRQLEEDGRQLSMMASSRRRRQSSAERQLLASGIFAGLRDERATAHRVAVDVENGGAWGTASRSFRYPESELELEPARASVLAHNPTHSRESSIDKKDGWKTRSLRAKFGLDARRSISAGSSVNSLSRFRQSLPVAAAAAMSRTTNFSQSQIRKRSAEESSDEERDPKRKSLGKTNGFKSRHWELRARGLVPMPDGNWLPESIANSVKDGRRYNGSGSYGLGPVLPDAMSDGEVDGLSSNADGDDHRGASPSSLQLRLARLRMPKLRHQHRNSIGGYSFGSPISGSESIFSSPPPAPPPQRKEESAKRKRSAEEDDDEVDSSPSIKKSHIGRDEAQAMVENTQKMLDELRQTMDRLDEDRPFLREHIGLLNPT
ncbi:SAC3/GANP/Nin1/mts3/eIF-3 p25 family-domain-containing protein [Cercophora scortea]|uniref:SAC3/GANP/Nin1/mts3/eIF-3 p25 family-domain-containing protein n=1 Tax=Cercophora scortea TaxID=314031 RepID=A0AAE0ILU3_9PEZI|nr:SAC3/GANP/Nin1/mts3/eIF-3 p25 family-domain-containing protein [Cercophora scortea]